MSRLIAALLLILFSGSGVLAGQAPGPTMLLRSGARIRITEAGENPRVAVLVARNSEELVVQGPKFETDEAVPLEKITRLEVSTGRHRNVLKGMGLGLAIGGTAGLLLGAVAYPGRCTGICIMGPETRGESAAMGGALLGTLGFVIGTIAGIPSHDTWQRVRVDESRVAFAISPRAAGTGLGVALRF